ncbi:MAG: TolC family protein [Cyclobacteriaceae bacterium]|nr:TolC family protein [Cyclobacteriaceae bacterium]
MALSVDAQEKMSMEECIRYAFGQQPLYQRQLLQQEFVALDIKSGLSGWTPQVNLATDFEYFLQQPVAIFPDFENPESGEFQEVETGVPYNANVYLTMQQSILSNRLIDIVRRKEVLKTRAEAMTKSARLDLIREVSAAYLQLALAEEQIQLIQGNIERQERQKKETQLQFESGLTDQVDYKRALIALSNSEAELKRAQEDQKIARSQLHLAMGRDPLEENVSTIDITEQIQKIVNNFTIEANEVSNRPEYTVQQSDLSLAAEDINFGKRAFMPELSAFFNYTILFQSPNGDELISQRFPYSTVGLRLSVPIFLGGMRIYEIQKAKIAYEQVELNERQLINRIDNEYTQAVADFRAAKTQWQKYAQNEQWAEEIYQTIKYQYEEGIINFLEVVVAEDDLRTARINRLNALFSAYEAKLAIDRARGEEIISYQN